MKWTDASPGFNLLTASVPLSLPPPTPTPPPTHTPQQNFGAALRCAAFLGVAGVLTCHRNSAPLSGVVSKASAGAMEVLTVHSCK